ncbi:MAG: two-component sensor histidine kinase [Filimonas sp.]|nr:two-component sensor histidine kinase [Filimonas sp.]
MRLLFRKHKLSVITTVYWFLLMYIITALIFWFVSLEKQNEQTFIYRVEQLKKDEPGYYEKVSSIDDARKRKHAQYIGEGSIFFLVILLGAVFVYRATRRQILLSHQQQNFMMAVTHELKTPISVIKLNIETVQKRKLDEAQQQKLLASSLLETSRLNTLCNNILLSSQLEARMYNANKQELDLSGLVGKSMEEFIERYPQRNFVREIQQDIVINGEDLLLQLLISNLVENAVKYTPKERPVTVRLAAGEKDKIVLSVEDFGPGIPADEKKNIFKKFYRIGNESTRSAKGTGLGLYLCKKIALAHKGSIEVYDNKPQGSIFTVTLQSV